MPNRVLAEAIKSSVLKLFGSQIALHNEIDLDDSVHDFMKMKQVRIYRGRYHDFMNTIPCLMLYLVSNEDNAAEMYLFLNTIDNYQTDSFDDFEDEDKTEIDLDNYECDKFTSKRMIIDALRHLDFIEPYKDELDSKIENLTDYQKQRIGQISDNFCNFVKLLESGTALSAYMNMITPGTYEA